MISGHADTDMCVPGCKTSVGGVVLVLLLARSQCATGVWKSSSLNNWIDRDHQQDRSKNKRCAHRQPMYWVRLRREIPVFGLDNMG
jgi:hypothetical protein